MFFKALAFTYCLQFKVVKFICCSTLLAFLHEGSLSLDNWTVQEEESWSVIVQFVKLTDWRLFA